MRNPLVFISSLYIILLSFSSCQSVDDERIPNMLVNISIADAGLWNTYGVSGFGSNRTFIYKTSGTSVPTGFPYKLGNGTGFGGVLLIEGMDPFSSVTAAPLAYDLSCPVERKPDIRVNIDNDTYVAICPECGSSYDVTMQKGAPISGVAATGKYKYALKSYKCIPSGNGGYFITN